MAPVKLRIEPEISPVRLELNQSTRMVSLPRATLALLSLALGLVVVGLVPAAAAGFGPVWSLPLFITGMCGAVVAFAAAVYTYYYYDAPKTTLQ